MHDSKHIGAFFAKIEQFLIFGKISSYENLVIYRVLRIYMIVNISGVFFAKREQFLIFVKISSYI